MGINFALETSGKGWTLCLIGEDQSNKLAELTQGLRGEFSTTGDGKKILSGFAYWSVGSAIAWDHACKDNFYFVMKESIKFFNSQWQQIHANNIKDKKYHYVSLGVGTGEKDQHILSILLNTNPDLLYFPIDMSSEMLRFGVQKATERLQLKNDVITIQIDFSIERNIGHLRELFDQIPNDNPVLFSLLGNTLANFQQDTELLQLLSKLMRPKDRLLIEVATTEDLNEEAAQTAAKEYATTRLFKEFVTSALFQNTDLNIDLNSILFQGSIETNKAILIKVLYPNSTGKKIDVMLPDRSVMNFEPQDTIRLLLTRKYTSDGIKKSISDSNLIIVDRLHTPFEVRSQSRFGIDLILLAPESSGVTPGISGTPLVTVWTPKR